jgi:hypothetical protein
MTLSSSTERIKMQGLPGEEQKCHVFFATADHPFGSRPVSVPGEFKVQFLLSRPGHLTFDEEQPSFIHSVVGDSHLRIEKRINDRQEAHDLISLRLIGNGDGWSIPFDCLVNDNELESSRVALLLDSALAMTTGTVTDLQENVLIRERAQWETIRTGTQAAGKLFRRAKPSAAFAEIFKSICEHSAFISGVLGSSRVNLVESPNY